MTTPAISVRGLSKRYRLGVISRKTLVEEIAYWRHKLRGRNPAEHMGKVCKQPGSKHKIGERASDFWALQDVSFDIQPGEIVGIIGHNGSGKSTLLKILSRVTEPTEGEAIIYGRVGSLLEVGTGFHPELTGRENVYMNGTILGMRKSEIEAKFDEIIAFSEIEKFIDTPVKRYSSGMYVRLAFAVAAHLEPEILLVDEVLAVGDAAFQKKCIGKMGDVARSGRTVLFVSHNMNAISNLCSRAIVMNHGHIDIDGPVQDAILTYLSSTLIDAEYQRPAPPLRITPRKLTIDRIALCRNGTPTSNHMTSGTLEVHIECSVREDIRAAQVAFELQTVDGTCLFCSTSQDHSGEKTTLTKGHHRFVCPIKLDWLRAGQYMIKATASVPAVEELDTSAPPVGFHLMDDTSPVLKLGQGRRGLILPVLSWQDDCIPDTSA